MSKSQSASDKIRILIADDHALMRVGIRSMLEMQHDMTVVGEAEDGMSVIELAAELKPDVIVMDLMMPIISGADATRRIRADDDRVKIVILSSYGTTVDMARALDNGANGALQKESPSDELISAIRAVFAGESAVAPEIARTRNDLFKTLQFSDKQLQVLTLLSKGLSDKDIGRLLNISRAGVQKHITALFSKLGAANRTEAITIAYETHLLKT